MQRARALARRPGRASGLARKKTGGYLFLQGRATSSQHVVTVQGRFNDNAVGVEPIDVDIPTATTGGVFGTAIWGVSLFGSSNRAMKKKRIDRSFFSVQFTLSNPYPDQPVEVTAFGFTGDLVAGQGGWVESVHA